jgi:hypothetical protein
MRRLCVALLAGCLLGTSCAPFWHRIVVPYGLPAANTSATPASRADVVAVVERIALAHRLLPRPAASSACTPHWSFPSPDSTGGYQIQGWPIVCMDTTRSHEIIVALDAGLRRLPPGSHADSLWRALQDGLAPLGGAAARHITPAQRPR